MYAIERLLPMSRIKLFLVIVWTGGLLFSGIETLPLTAKSPMAHGSGNHSLSLLPFGLGDLSASPLTLSSSGLGSIRYTQFFPNSVGLLDPLSGTLLTGSLSVELPISPYLAVGALWHYQGFGDSARDFYGEKTGSFASMESLFQGALRFSTFPLRMKNMGDKGLFFFPLRVGLGISALASGLAVESTSPASLSEVYALLVNGAADIKLFDLLRFGILFRNFDFRFNPNSMLNFPFEFQTGFHLEVGLGEFLFIPSLSFEYLEGSVPRLDLSSAFFWNLAPRKSSSRAELLPFLPVRTGFSLRLHSDLAFAYPLNVGASLFIDMGGTQKFFRFSYGVEYKTLSGFDQSLGVAYYFD